MRTLFASLLTLASCAIAFAQDAPIRYGDVEKLCDLENKKIDESSGVAVGRLNEGTFWTHNDSGDKPRIYAFDLKGRSLARIKVKGAKAIDWEDMASFTLGKKHFLLLADVGDNNRQRGSSELYIVQEPRVPPTGKKSVEIDVKISFTWRGGPQNCEAVAVDPKAKIIYLACKEFGERSRVFTLPLPKTSPKGPQVAEPLVDLPHRLVTGMDMSPDGRRAVVVTYTEGFIYTRGKDETWKEAFARDPQPLQLPERKQGEAVCYGAEGRSIYLTTEQLPAPFHVFRAIKPKPTD